MTTSARDPLDGSGDYPDQDSAVSGVPGSLSEDPSDLPALLDEPCVSVVIAVSFVLLIVVVVVIELMSPRHL